MYAILRVDLQRGLARFLTHDLVHAGRTIPLLGRAVLGEIDGDRHRVVLQGEMHRLVFLVIGVREEDRRVPVEAHHAVGLRVLDTRTLRSLPERRMVGMVAQRPWRLAPQQVGIEPGVEHPAPQPPVKRRPEVAHAVQLVPQPRVLETRPVVGDLRRGRPVAECLEDRFRGGHSGLHRGVRALDLRHVEEAGGVSHQQPARERELRERLETPFADSPARRRRLSVRPRTWDESSDGS